MARYIVHAPDIECEGCANAIRTGLGRVTGVRKVDVDVENKTVDVEYDQDEVGELLIAERLTNMGFPPRRG